MTEELRAWMEHHEGIVHREDALAAGFSLGALRDFMRSGQARMIRRAWAALPHAVPALVTAAEAGGRVTCVTLARRRKWWMPESVDTRVHLHLRPHAGAARLPESWPGVLHWTQPIAPVGRTLEAPIEDALAHIAVCLPFDTALVLWESASRVEVLSPEALRAIAWRGPAARELAAAVTGLADSGLETLVVTPLRRMGLRVRQQVKLAGHLVDALVGDRLVLQIDGYEHHASSGQRTKDIALDAELRLRGYTVLRFSYRQIVHEWRAVERIIARAVAAGLHLSP